MAPAFEWDMRKAALNVAKHSITFEETASAFNDPLARIFDDPEHSIEEAHEILVGHSSELRLLLISFREVAPNRIRLISARLATRREKHTYEENVEA